VTSFLRVFESKKIEAKGGELAVVLERFET